MNRAFSLEAGTREGHVQASVLDGLENLAGFGVANVPQIGDLINAVIPGDVVPLLGYTHCSLAGQPEKVYPADSV
jgi:hypothetical protein